MYLAGMSKDVLAFARNSSLVIPKEPDADLMPGLMPFKFGYPLVQGDALTVAIKDIPNLDVKVGLTPIRITDEGIIVNEREVGEHLIEADTVILAAGQRPLTDEAWAFANAALEMKGDRLDLPGVPYFSIVWYHSPGQHEEIETHTHDFDEIVGFMGSNPDDP